MYTRRPPSPPSNETPNMDSPSTSAALRAPERESCTTACRRRPRTSACRGSLEMYPSGRIRWGVAVMVAAVFLLPVPGQALAGSPNVAALQAALKVKGLYTAEVDGVPG